MGHSGQLTVERRSVSGIPVGEDWEQLESMEGSASGSHEE